MDERIYEPAFVRALFDEMARTYGIVNLISSFGFAARWRKQCVRTIVLSPGWTVLDLMTGMGELCPDLARFLGHSGVIRAVDLSPNMCRRAKQIANKCACRVEIIEANALENDIESASADAIVSSFGLKTFSAVQTRQLMNQIARLLKPGGLFSLLEISMPGNRLLRWPYMFYIKHVIPLIGRAFLGNPENYRMLGVYTEEFRDCELVKRECDRAGLVAQQLSVFFGCATGVYGHKPE